MSGEIYLVRDGGELVAMAEQPYDSEAVLQELLANYPRILAGDQIKPDDPRRWLLVKREVGVPSEEGGGNRWSLDHLFLDQDGVPTLVEVKQSTNTQIRREVVGQLLDYAANAMAYWSLETVRVSFEQTCKERNLVPEDVLAEFLGPEGDSYSFWQTVKTNLQAGRLRLLFVADQIPNELRRIVEFLNEQMDPAEVLAVEIRQFAGESHKTLVPRVLGQITKGPPTDPGKHWDEPSFFAKMEAHDGSEQTEVARRILDWARQRVTHISWGKGETRGSFVPVLEHGGARHQLFAVYTGGGSGGGCLETYFIYWKSKPPFDSVEMRKEMLRRLNQIPGVQLPDESIEKRPSIELAIFTKESALKQLFAVMEWYLDEVRKV